MTNMQNFGVTEVTEVTALNHKGKHGNPMPSWPGLPGVTDPLEAATDPVNEPPPDGVETEKPPKVAECPCWRVYLDWWKDGNRSNRPGVWYHGIRETEDGGTRTDEWLCGPLVMDSVTFDRRGESFGRLVRFRDSIGRWHTWNMPMMLLKGSGEELRGELLRLGLEIDPKGRARLPNYLMHRTPKDRVTAALTVGWNDAAFVLPDAVFGNARIYFQCETASVADFDQRGSLDDWRDSVASLAPGNMPLTLAISAAFAGPVMALAHVESCGAHLVGDSSSGKTTALQAAASVWGPPGFVRTWRATSNGLEAAAAESNDTLLILDEIGEADPNDIGSVIYALGNGRGKSRANRHGYARPGARWRTVLLSRGDKSLETHMADGRRSIRAGQSVRLLDIPVSGRFGAFDDLHGRDNGRSFADEIKTACSQHYGTAGRSFLRFLIHNRTEDYGAILKGFTDRIPADGGQEARAARQMALVGMAGELAIRAGITGWEPGAAFNAAVAAFNAWRNQRGSGNAETHKILAAVRDFIDAHGDSRFSDRTDTRPVRDRAGYVENLPTGELLHLFSPGGMREALSGYDMTRALDVLQAAGWLIPGSDKRQVQRKVNGRNQKLYAVVIPDDDAQDAA